MWHLTDKKYRNVPVFHCESNHIHASDPGSQVAEGLEEEVRVVKLIKKEKKTGTTREKNVWKLNVWTNILCSCVSQEMQS